VACNTATAAAIAQLRQTYPDLPIVGVEPALKPAAQISRTGRVAVLATRGTLESAKFAALRDSLPQTAFACVPCDGLADRIERLSEGQSARLEEALETTDLIAVCADFIRAAGQFGLKTGMADTLVLGCTHYPLIRHVFRSLVGQAITMVDNAAPVAQRTVQLMADRRAPEDQVGEVVWRSSSDSVQLLKAAHYWGVEPR
jgi:glutamate racemase